MKRKSRSRSRSPSRPPFDIDWPRVRPAPFSAPPPLLPPQHGLYPPYHPQVTTLPLPVPPPPPPPRPVPLGPVHPSLHLSHSAPFSQDDRIRRNVACTRCRDSKVRCLTSPNSGEACQRCAKLGIPEECRFDKGHKRRTKANKLDLLEKELNTIKQQVETNGGPRSASFNSTSPSTRTVSTSGPTSTPSWPSPRPRPSPTKDYAPPVSASRHIPADIPSPHSEDQTPVAGSDRLAKPMPTKPRNLGGLTVSANDIQFYFDKYIQFYHPLLPILRETEPNSCYESHPTLFWVILFVSSRRFSRDEALYTALVEELSQTPWLMLSTASATLESIHALLIICNWPLPSIRFLTDPCPSLLAVATVACMQLGLHLGKGTGEDYGCGERHNAKCTDEEAASTWLSCCMLSTKAATAAGIPPPSIQYDDQECKRSLKDPVWAELIAFYDLQKWLNRFHAAMAAQVASGQAITTSIVSFWESQFEAIKPSLVRIDTDLMETAVLSARLEIKTYYLSNPPLPVPPYLASHVISIFSTARTHLNLLSTLDSASEHLRHHSQWSFRALLDTASLVIFCLHQRTACCPELSETEATELAREAWSAVGRCSVREGDIAQKVSAFMETFWRIRGRVPRGELPAGSWQNRLAVGVTFWCLKIIKIALVDAKILPDDSKIGTEHTKNAKGLTGGETTTPETPKDKDSEKGGIDDLLGIDWSFLFEDVGLSTSDLVHSEPKDFSTS